MSKRVKIGKDSKKDQAREIAERRGSHFARSSSSAAHNRSTPSGVVRDETSSTQRREFDGITGPFSIANQILNKKKNDDSPAGMLEGSNSRSKDEYDEILNTLVQRHKRKLDEVVLENKKIPPEKEKENRSRLTGPIDSLELLSVRTIVSVFDKVDDLVGLSNETLTHIAVELGKARKLDKNAALLLANHGTDALSLPECSLIDEATLLHAINKVRGMLLTVDDIDKSAYSEEELKTVDLEQELVKYRNAMFRIRIISLKNAGHCFTDRIATTISTDIGDDLETLHATGCYKLGDEALQTLTQSCSSLVNLDLSTNSRLGPQGLSAISLLGTLSSLTLDFCTHLVDSDMMSLISSSAQPLPKLEHLSMRGLSQLTDKSITALIAKFGPALRGLSVSGCPLLTDDTVMSIRSHCGRLTMLDLSELQKLTTSSLLALFLDISCAREQLKSRAEEDATAQDIENNDDDMQEDTPEVEAETEVKKLLIEGGNSMFKHIGKLVQVYLRGVSNVTDDVMRHLSESHRTLEVLDISGCGKVGNKAIVCIAQNCSNSLKDVDISFVRGIQDPVLVYLVNKCSQLQKLSLWSCTQLTNDFFHEHKNHDLVIVGSNMSLYS